jgi:hypothetical protein
VVPKVLVAAQAVTIGTLFRSAIRAPGSTKESVQDPSSASTCSSVISLVTLFTVTFGSVLSSSRVSSTFRLDPPTWMPPAAFTSSTACW